MSDTRWHQIETAPVGVRVLVIEMSRTDPIPVAATRGKNHGRWHSIPGAYQIKPTHWMPLPDPPEAGEATPPPQFVKHVADFIAHLERCHADSRYESVWTIYAVHGFKIERIFDKWLHEGRSPEGRARKCDHDGVTTGDRVGNVSVGQGKRAHDENLTVETSGTLRSETCLNDGAAVTAEGSDAGSIPADSLSSLPAQTPPAPTEERP